MHFGVSIFATDETPSAIELARLVEDRGFESFWLPEHTHIPASRETPYPVGGELPPEYWHTIDPIVGLAAAAAVTTTLKLGTAISLIVERDPIVMAKEVASLDLISGGRVLLGVGAGWNFEEMRNHGTDPRTRMRLMRERVEAMKAIWTQDEPSYEGEFVSFGPLWSWPKPVQSPHPPVLIGGNGRTVHDRVLGFGDGWLPNPYPTDELLLRLVAKLNERAGRTVPVTLNATSADPARIAAYAEAGIERCIFFAPSAGLDRIEARLDAVREAIDGSGVTT